jgi:hypothetical protein
MVRKKQKKGVRDGTHTGEAVDHAGLRNKAIAASFQKDGGVDVRHSVTVPRCHLSHPQPTILRVNTGIHT